MATLLVICDNIEKTDFAGNHIATDWQFSDTSDFSNIVHESLNDANNLLSYVYNGVLFLDQSGDMEGIYARTRLKTQTVDSNWSQPTYYSREV